MQPVADASQVSDYDVSSHGHTSRDEPNMTNSATEPGLAGVVIVPPQFKEECSPSVDSEGSSLPVDGHTPDLQPHLRGVSTQGLTLMIPTKVNGEETYAVVDTAAQVTIISQDFAASMAKPLRLSDNIQCKNAENNNWMEGRWAKNVRFTIGRKQYKINVVVAPITDNVILGLDFLKEHKAVVNLKDNNLILGKEVIQASLRRGPGGSVYRVSRVFLAKRIVVPPNSVKMASARLESPAESMFVVQPTQRNQGLMMSATLVNGSESEIHVSFINDSDKYLKLNRDTLIGEAMEADISLIEEKQVPPLVTDTESDSGSASDSDTDISGLESDGYDELISDDDDSPVPHIRLVSASDAAPPVQAETYVTTDSDSTVPGAKPEKEVDPVDILRQQLSELRQMEDTDLEVQHKRLLKELPSHLMVVYEKSADHLSLRENAQVLQLLTHFADVFSTDNLDIGKFEGVEHKIDLVDDTPIRTKLRRTPTKYQDDEEKTLQAMLDAKVIQPSTSEWASAPVLVRKRDGSIRYCIDYRNLNKKTVKDAFPLPKIEECLDTLSGTMYFSMLDLLSGYWQIPIREEDRPKTAFLTKFGLFEHTRMPFGLCNAPATFQRAMNLILRGLTWLEVLAYLDDVIVLGKSFTGGMDSLIETFVRFRKNNVKAKPPKCALFQLEGEVLGKTASREGIRITQGKLDQVLNWPVPTSKKQLEAYLGFMNYHRSFVQGYAGISACLYALVNPKAKFVWGEEHQAAYDRIKASLAASTILAYPTPDDQFILDCDASDFAIGAALSQLQNSVERVIEFGSATLTPTQRKYCTTRRELLAVVRFTRQFRHYLLGRQVIVRTDHSSLLWLTRFKHIEGQLARWLEELAQYDIVIQHRPGSKHSNADGLSRIPSATRPCNCYEAGRDLDSLPCGGCRHCARLHEQWHRFEMDVDDVVPMALREEATSMSVRQVISQTSQSDTPQAMQPSNGTQSSQSDMPQAMPPNNGTQTSQSDVPQVMPPNNGTPLSQTDPEDMNVSWLFESQAVDTQAKENDTEPGYYSNYIQDYDSVQLRDLQLQDMDLQPIISWLERGEDPSEAELFLCSAATKHIWSCRSQLQLKHGVLFYEWEHVSKTRLKLIVPHSKKTQVLEKVHDTKVGGHFGCQKTYIKAKQSFYWFRMKHDVIQYVRTCHICSKNKKARRHRRASLRSYQAGNPGERVHMDILGPFNESTSGNRYVLMMIDQFTKWLECKALPEQSAEKIAQSFFEDWVARFGTPGQCHTDQGRNFDSNLFRVLCELLEIAKTRTTPYHPSGNGVVERINSPSAQFLRCFIEGKHKDWDRYIPALGMALRATVNQDTGYTPNMMVLGREVTVPSDIIFGVAEANTEPQTAPEYVTNLVETLRQVHEQARVNLQATQLRMKKYYDPRCYQTKYSRGDLVYRLDESTKIGHSKKLRPVWLGPYIVQDVLSPVLYRLITRKGTTVIHHDKIKLCEDRVVPLWVRRKRHSLLDLDKTLPDFVQSSQDVTAQVTDQTVHHDDQVQTQVVPPEVVDHDGTAALDDVPSDTQPELTSSPAGDGENIVATTSVVGRINSDLEETLPYGNDPSQDESMVLDQSSYEDPDKYVGLANLFDEPITSRKGRIINRPPRLQDYV